MLKSELIKALQESIEVSGDNCLGARALIALGCPNHLREFDARQRIMLQIAQAKRELRAPMKSSFFDEIWPKAAAALKGYPAC